MILRTKKKPVESPSIGKIVPHQLSRWVSPFNFTKSDIKIVSITECKTNLLNFIEQLVVAKENCQQTLHKTIGHIRPNFKKKRASADIFGVRQKINQIQSNEKISRTSACISTEKIQFVYCYQKQEMLETIIHKGRRF